MRSFFRLKIIAVFLQYDTEKYPAAFENFKMYLKRQLPKERFVLILVDNKHEGDEIRWLDDNTVYMQGDNTDWEFSGWQKGIAFARENRLQYDVALLANDSFQVNGTPFITNHNIEWSVLKSYYLSAVIGFVETRWQKARIKDKVVRIWLRTDCFFVPKRVVDALGTLVSVDQASLDEYLPKTFSAGDIVFMPTAPLNLIFKDRIIEWVTVEWHSKFGIRESTWALFRGKTKAILNEALLYTRIRDLGYPVIPYDVPGFLFRKLGGIYKKMVPVISHRCRAGAGTER